MQTWRENQLYDTLGKYEYWQEKVVFLGHAVSKEGTKVDPQKMKTIIEWSTSINVIEIRNFMSLVGYYQRFVKLFFTGSFFSYHCVEKTIIYLTKRETKHEKAYLKML